MKWIRFVGQTGISYYSGKIGDKDCRWIHEHEGKFLVDNGPVFVGTLEEAKEYHHDMATGTATDDGRRTEDEGAG